MTQSGQSCAVDFLSPAASSFAKYTAYAGVENGSATSRMTLDCPINWKTDVTTQMQASSVTVRYKDANSQTIEDGAVYCAVFAEDPAGTIFSGPARFSCSTAGGCATFTASTYTNITGFLTLPTPVTGNYYDFAIQCSVPPTDPTTHFISYILGYSTSYNQSL
jgi:hypothetical protein